MTMIANKSNLKDVFGIAKGKVKENLQQLKDEAMEGWDSKTSNTSLMVEDILRRAKGLMTLAQVKQKLTHKVDQMTLKAILSSLKKEGKIEFTPQGVVWISIPREDLKSIEDKGRTWT